MRNFTLLSFGIGAMILAGQHAQAQTANCAPHDIITERLITRYGERRQAMGLGGGNTVLELYASDAGTWSILITSPDGISCLVAAGRAFTLSVVQGQPT